MLFAARTSRSCRTPQLEHVQIRSERPRERLMTPQLHSLLDGSKRPILMTVLPCHAALYSICRTNSYHEASAIDLDSLRFRCIPDTFKSSSATAWFSRMMRVESLCRKSVRWFRIFSLANATRTRCLALLLLPLTLRESLLCSLANLSSDALSRRGLSIFSPSLNVAKWV